MAAGWAHGDWSQGQGSTTPVQQPHCQPTMCGKMQAAAALLALSSGSESLILQPPPGRNSHTPPHSVMRALLHSTATAEGQGRQGKGDRPWSSTLGGRVWNSFPGAASTASCRTVPPISTKCIPSLVMAPAHSARQPPLPAAASRASTFAQHPPEHAPSFDSKYRSL